MGKEQDLMHLLDSLATEDTPLTDTEMDRLTRQVLGRTQTKTKPASHARRKGKWPVWSKAFAGAAACVVLLAGVNGINPAWAEDLPVLGDVFAYINGLPKGYLQSEQLGEYAQPAQIQADSDAPDESSASEPAGQPIQLTLSQIYCDGLYLRLGLTLTAEDDSLADFEVVTIDPPLLWEDTTQTEANTLYGGVTLNGEAVGGDLLPCFRKQDAHTFVCEMDYNLQDYTGSLENMQASLTLSNLVGVKGTTGAVGDEEKTPLAGSYTLSFTVSANGTLTRKGQIKGGEQNHVSLIGVQAAPGETRIQYSVNGPLPDNATPAMRLFAVQDGNLTKLQPASGSIQNGEGQSETVYTDYFDAVPEGVTELQAEVLDKNARTELILAQWTITLPQ